MNDQHKWLEAVLKEFERKESLGQVISVEEKILVGTGENYLSQVKKLVVQAVRGDGEIVTESFIAKLLPIGSKTREMVLQGGISFTEFTIYRDVLSAMDLVLKEKGIFDETIWPKCIALQPYEKLLFEDLTACGYKMADRLEGLDLNHSILVVRSLGLFHALSLVMKERGLLSNVVFGEHFSVKTYEDFRAWVNCGYEKLLVEIETWGDEWHSSLERMKDKQPEYGELILNLLRSSENRFTVLNHGDPWTNNMLFKHDAYTGEPIHMRFVDFQLSFLGSPAYDLMYFLISSPNLDVQLHHKKYLVRTYHDSLKFNMRRLGVTEKPPTFECIESEMKRLAYLRFYFMTLLLVLVTKKPEDSYNFEDVLEEAKEAAFNQGMKSWMTNIDDHLRTLYQLNVKEAEFEGTL